ncbi:sn-glycerol-3-phosphate ABC transporter ATP-binding protein UgpC [Cohaesibacter sp. CAU 1516]|uniref:ABC transporter ATP-binding protein n=1 Tax=Cohaesibacter sp. CAU 1516 TaxID=2576038 RepID=UPI0010FEB9C0|nr:sn-glycerol-3-phosphate ABC transporter ATP-binding protein UgpC [Cohaesibacter sp. CAU 1516]TLP49273.1 sn-glycerol-3-phosphate ABC transporter ATP-binding protein UgpC [Cohaesibacter sp. CAU 1516]
MTSIHLDNAAKRFGRATVLNDINLEIEDGEFCVFLGPSGCGKSTLLRMIAGIETLTQGELKIGDQRMNEALPAERRVAMVFQNYALYPHMSVYENMAFGLKQAKTPKDQIVERVGEAARILQIENLLERKPKELSGGQRQRVAIGRAIVRQPAVFLFDEPLSNLDAALRVHMRTEIANLHRKFPEASMIYVTHDQTEAMALADKIVLLRAGDDVITKGSIAQTGSPLELYHRPKNLFVAGFLGSPSMNFLPVTLVAASEDGARVKLDSDEELFVPVSAGHLPIGAKLTLGIRPEHMTPVGEAVTEQVFSRALNAVENFGEYSFLYLSESTDAPMIAKVSDETEVSLRGAIKFQIRPELCHLFDEAGDALTHLNPAPKSISFDATAL